MNLKKITSYIILSLVAVSILLPIFWLIIISFKTRVDALSIPPNWIFKPTFVNYKSLFNGDSLKAIFNSLIIASLSATLVLLLAIPAAYSFSRLSLKKLKNSFFFIMTMRMIPPAVIIIPIFLIFSRISLIDNYIGIILIHIAVNVPIAVWLIKVVFDRTPKSIDEAALIDGATFFQLLKHHVIPIHKLSLMIMFLVSFILSWNEFFLGMILTAFDKRPLTVAISSFMTPHGTNWGQLAALTLISFIPIILLIYYLYILLKKTKTDE